MKPRCHSETHFTAPRSQKTNTTTNLKDKKQLTEGKKYLKYISKLLIPLVCEQLESITKEQTRQKKKKKTQTSLPILNTFNKEPFDVQREQSPNPNSL